MKITISIPEYAKVVAKVGDEIKLGGPLFEIDTQKSVSVNVAQALQIANDQLFHCLVRVIGDSVKKGDLLAQKKGMLKTKKLFAQWDGTIKEINHETGEITLSIKTSQDGIQETSKKQSFFSGKVESVDTGTERVIVSITQGISIPLKRASEDGGGVIFYCTEDSHYFTATEDDIKDKIIVSRDLKSHIIAKCEALGATGFVYLTAGSIPQHGASISNISDYNTLIETKKKFILYSALEKKAVAYT